MAEESDRLSADIMNRIREQRKLRRQDITRKVAAGVGGAAETFRTGQSAKSVFDRLRPDYSDQMMDKREKMERSRSIVDKMDARERYVFGKATADAQNRALITRENRDRQNQRDLDQAQRQDVAIRARVEAEMSAHNKAVDTNFKKQKALEKPSEMAKAYFADMPTYEQRVDAEADWVIEDSKPKPPSFNRNKSIELRKDLGLPPDASDKEIKDAIKTGNTPAAMDMRKNASDTAKQDAKARIESLASSNPQDKDLVWAVTEAAIKSGTSAAEIHQSLDVNTQEQTKEAEQNHAEELEDINLENDEIVGKYQRDKLFGPGRKEPFLSDEVPRYRDPGLLEESAKKIYATKLAELEDVDVEAGIATSEDMQRVQRLLAMDEALAARQAEQTEAIGGEGVEQQQAGFLGFEGIEKPGPGSQAHFRKLLEVIEKFPESPPAQHAKQQIMNTQEFKDYQKKNFGDLNIDQNKVYREMVRDWRRQNREDMAKFRAKRSEKRRREREESMSRPLRDPAKKRTSTVVSGATPPGSTGTDPLDLVDR